MHNALRKFSIAVFSALALVFVACSPPEDTNKNSNAATPQMTEFERDLKSFKTAGFDYIFVLKRKDGGKMTSEDKQFIRDRRHYATNRSKVSEDETTVFIGSNFAFEDKNLKELKERFVFEDFSKPAEQIEKRKLERKANKAENGSAEKSNGSVTPD
jgi:hypothetical protein